MTDISVIIPTKNEERNIRSCIEKVLAQKIPLSFEIVVIDSGSQDDTLKIVQSFKEVKWFQIPPEEFGHGRTRNLGLAHGKGNFLVFLNADAIPADDNWLKGLIDGFEMGENVAAVYSRHLPQSDCRYYMRRDLATSMPDQVRLIDRVETRDFMVFSTVSAAIRREVFQTHPFLKDILIAEDQEWGKRIIKKGFVLVYTPPFIRLPLSQLQAQRNFLG